MYSLPLEATYPGQCVFIYGLVNDTVSSTDHNVE